RAISASTSCVSRVSSRMTCHRTSSDARCAPESLGPGGLVMKRIERSRVLSSALLYPGGDQQAGGSGKTRKGTGGGAARRHVVRGERGPVQYVDEIAGRRVTWHDENRGVVRGVVVYKRGKRGRTRAQIDQVGPGIPVATRAACRENRLNVTGKRR